MSIQSTSAAGSHTANAAPAGATDGAPGIGIELKPQKRNKSEQSRYIRQMILATSLIWGGLITGAAGAAASPPSDGTAQHVPPGQRPTQLVVFGDSNTDTGMQDIERDSAHFRTLPLLPAGLVSLIPPPNVGGRNSNGPVLVEYAATSLGVPLVNYSVSGAKSGRTHAAESIFPALANTGALAQVEAFEQSLGDRRADQKGIYLIFAGSNDLGDLVNPTEQQLQARIDQVVLNVTEAVTRLDARGARDILVATRTPRPDLGSENNQWGLRLNDALIAAMGDLDHTLKANVQIFDAYSLVADMMTDGGQYARFPQPTAECILVPTCATNLNVAATYVQWDGAHKTTRVHELLSDALVDQALSMRAVPQGNR